MFKRNLYTGAIASAAAILLPIIVIPVFTRSLGLEKWGIISFTVTLQAIASIMEAGAGQAISRRTALIYRNDRASGALHEFFVGSETVYGAAAIALTICGALALSVHPQGWLDVSASAESDAALALQFCVALVLFQVPGLLYKSMSVGTPTQPAMNLLIAAFLLIRYAGAAVAVARYGTVAAYFAWTLGAVFFETLARRWLVARNLAGSSRSSRWECTRRLRPMAGEVAWAVLTVGAGAAVTQIDRVVLSSLLSASEFGTYTLAATLAYGVVQLIYPLMQAAFPRLVAAQSSTDELARLNRKLVIAVSLGVCLLALVYQVLGGWALRHWLNDKTLAEQVEKPLTALLIGSVLNAFYNIGYNNLLAAGRFKKIMWINLAGGGVALIAIPLSVEYFGMSGGAAGWIAISAIGAAATFGFLRSTNERT